MKYAFHTFKNGNLPAELGEFRYRIYVQEMQRAQKDACHETKTIKDFLDQDGHNAVAYDGDTIVGCIRVNFLREGPVGPYETFYQLNDLTFEERRAASICTRLMIDPKYRLTTLSISLLRYIYTYGLRHNIETCHMDCNRPLLNFFKKYGYVHCYDQVHEEYGDVSILRLDLNDVEHMQRTRSPFLNARKAFFAEKPSVFDESNIRWNRQRLLKETVQA